MGPTTTRLTRRDDRRRRIRTTNEVHVCAFDTTVTFVRRRNHINILVFWQNYKLFIDCMMSDADREFSTETCGCMNDRLVEGKKGSSG